MKRYILHIIALFVACVISSGVWAEDKTGSITTQTITTNITWNLTGDVNITGTITINDRGTLTIIGNNHTIMALTGDGSSSKTSFIVNGGGTLNINNAIVTGGNEGSIGGHVGEEDVQEYSDFKKSGRFISLNNTAKVYLTDVTAQYLYSINEDVVPFVQLSGIEGGTSKTSRGLLKMERCKVQHCLNRVDNGIIHQSGGYMHADIDIDDSIITNCVIQANNTGTGYGGVIKGAGSTDCNLTMDNSTMKYCWSSGWGGAVLWAASGGGCKAVFKNCEFQYNYARYLGGAISSESTIELQDCNLSYNKAGYGGGALAAFPFTLTQTDGVTDNSTAIGLKLENNIIEHNVTLFSTNYNGDNVPTNIRAKESNGTDQIVGLEVDGYFNPRYTLLNATDIYYPTGGGGIWVLMNKDGWNCNLNIGSNQINNNESANDAGGVLLFKQIPYRKTAKGEEGYENEKVIILKDYTTVDGKQTGITTMTISAHVYSNVAANSGGGIAIGSSANPPVTWTYPDVTVSGGYIKNNIATNLNGGGLYMPGGNFMINGSTEISGNSATKGNGGGIYLGGGNFTVNGTGVLNLGGDATEEGNSAGKNGGAIYCYAPFTVNDNGRLVMKNNRSSDDGGAVYCDAEFNVGHNGILTMEKNSAEGNGGAVYCNAEFTVGSESIIKNNSAGVNGGAVFVNGGSININGISNISNNNAMNDGGAAFVKNGTIKLNENALMSSNSATNGSGGVFYVTKSSEYTETVGVNTSTGTMSFNTASNGSGGVFFVDGGNIELGGKTVMNQNQAKNGGAIALQGGVFTINPESLITHNTATGDGGGLWVNNTTGNPIKCLGGSFDYNTAGGNGGGLYAAGAFDFHFAANLQDNQAVNGGGIYLDDGIRMKFGISPEDTENASIKDNGLIVRNIAKPTDNSRSTTDGTGGGIYLNKGSLKFLNTESLGVYNNEASYEAADIYSSGTSTELTLPNVSDMNLTGFDVAGSILYWIKDFNEKRYQVALKNMNENIFGMVVDIKDGNDEKFTEEMCLDLGYDMVFLELDTEGLYEGDVVTLSMYYDKNKGAAGTERHWQLYRKALLHGTTSKTSSSSSDNNTSVVKVGLPTGDWKFEASNYDSEYTGHSYEGYSRNGDKLLPKESTNVYEISKPQTIKLYVIYSLKQNNVINTPQFYKVNTMIPKQTTSSL